jgi:hypothetical protein
MGTSCGFLLAKTSLAKRINIFKGIKKWVA